MSIFSSIGNVLKKAAPVLGAVAGNALLPGIGGVIGGGLGGLVSGGPGGAALGAGGAALANTLSPGAGFSLGGLKEGGNILKTNGAGGLASLLTNGGGSSLATLAPLALAGGSIYSGAKQQQQQSELNNKILGMLQQDQDAKTQTRNQLLARLQNPAPTAPNLAPLFAGNQNPFARRTA